MNPKVLVVIGFILQFLINSIIAQTNPKITDIDTFFVDCSIETDSFEVPNSTWNTVFKHLEYALERAKSQDIIFLATGTCIPQADTGFFIKSGLKILGGFTQTGEGNWVQDSLTFLSGEIGLASKEDNIGPVVKCINQGKDAEDTITLSRIGIINGFNKDNGGGLEIIDSAVKLENLLFENNESQLGGGAVYILEGNLKLSGCEFHSDTALTGGAIHSEQSIVCSLNSKYNLNMAKSRGGAIFLENSPSNFQTSIFSNNSSNSNGGGGYLINSNTKFEGTIFSKNRSKGLNGGALYTASESVNILNCSFIKNKANDHGGAIYNLQASLKINRSRFDGNSTICINDTINCGFDGGAIYNRSNVGFNINSSEFFDNTAARNGGAILQRASEGSILINNSTSQSNKAKNGGAFFLNTSGGVSLLNCTLTENIVTESGGVIQIEKGFIDINYTTIVENKSDSINGGIANTGGNVSFSNSIIALNSSPRDSINISGEHVSNGYNLLSFDPNQIFQESLRDTIVPPLLVASGLLPLDYYGGPLVGAKIDTLNYRDSLRTIALKENSLARNGGTPINSLDPTLRNSLTDQRGHSRVIGSGNGLTDIGSYELQYTFIEKDTLVACLVEAPLTINPIVIIDSTGGAWRVDNAEPISITLSFEPKAYFDTSRIPTLTLIGEGLAPSPGFQPIVTDTTITIKFIRNYDTQINFIELSEITLDATKLIPGDFFLKQVEVPAPNPLGNFWVDSLADSQKPSFIDLDILSLPAEELPFFENFENNEFGNWTSESDSSIFSPWTLTHKDELALPFTVDSTNNHIVGTNITVPYKENEGSWVMSPCIDLRSLEKPFVSLDIWSDTDSLFAGTVLQITTDNGKSWSTIGTTNSGINWFDSQFVISNPADQKDGERFGWTGEYSGFISAAHELDEYVQSSQGAVRFRLYFKAAELISDSSTSTKAGFAFDNFYIGERSRNVLVEHFTSDTQEANNKTLQEKVESSNTDDVVYVQYRIEADDPFFQQGIDGIDSLKFYRGEQLARALYYGIGTADPPKAVIGGKDYNDLAGSLSSDDIGKAKLIRSPFDISFDSASNLIHFECIDASLIKGPTIPFIAIVNTFDNENGTRENVLLKFLPNITGDTVFSRDTFLSNPKQSVKVEWTAPDFPSSSIAKGFENMKVVAWIQDAISKEIYQVADTSVWETIIQFATKRRGKDSNGIKNPISIYPNPATNSISFEGLPETFEQIEAHFYSMEGEYVETFSLPENLTEAIEIQHLPRGTYIVFLATEKETLHISKVIKL